MGPRPAAALLLVLLVLAAAAAARGGDIEDLRRLLAEDRAAHLDRDPALIASHVADSLVSVDAGRVEVLSRGEVEAFFRGYFAGAVYRTWDDTEAPRIRVSDDAAMAWVVRRVRVDREEPSFGGGRARRMFTGAWTATYEKEAGAWKMTSVTSTFLPGLTQADSILAAVRVRLGGDDRVGGVRCILSEAEVYGPGAPFTVSVRSTRDGAVRAAWSTGFSGAIAPDTSWTLSTGASAPLSPELATLLRGHEAHMIAVAPETRYGPLAFTGHVDFGGQPALRLSGADPLGGAFEYYVAEEDSLPLGYVVADHAGDDPEFPVTVRLDHWRDTDGILLFQTCRFEQGDETYHYRYTRVDPAADPAPTAFSRP